MFHNVILNNVFHVSKKHTGELGLKTALMETMGFQHWLLKLNI